MTNPIGQNTVASQELRGFIDRVENIDLQRKALGEDRKLIFQEAKSKGYIKSGIDYVINARKMKPHDRQDAEAIRDMYMHAAGMDAEPPLFRQINALARDAAGSEKLLDAFKQLVPPQGEIIVSLGGKRVRIWRDKDGGAHSEDYVPLDIGSGPGGSGPSIPARVKPEAPNCTAEEAFALGVQAAKDNIAVINNPFPFGDERRPRWDEGWRAGSGNDGMGGA